MDVLARHRTLGMTHERRDGHLGKTDRWQCSRSCDAGRVASHRIAGNPRRDVSNGSGSCRKRCPHTARGRRMFQHRRCAVAPDIRQRASRRDGWIHPPYCPAIASS
jgi:hypothetical protein